MAKSKTRVSSLAKLLEGAPALVYVLNLEFEIQYASKACAEWVGLELDQLVGQRCVYTSSELDNETRNRLRGLCPPPAIQTERSIQATIFSQDQDKLRYRKVHFTRLDNHGPESTGLIIAIAEASDQPAGERAGNQDYQDLHVQLMTLYRELNANCKLDQLVGSSPAAKRMQRQARVAIECQSDLLIVGPPGTGKAHLAQTIFHERTEPDDQLVTLQGALIDREMLQTKIKEWVYEQRDRTGKDWLLILDVDQLDLAAQQNFTASHRSPNFVYESWQPLPVA
ncbi:MAG: sigma 54-interacting transcriptional regulator [Mariniblastus sp.]|nr:sigma 54-interacting transcriptional regulator [Mariniblastus sp.]